MTISKMRIVFVSIRQQYAIIRGDSYLGFYGCHSDALSALISIGG